MTESLAQLAKGALQRSCRRVRRDAGERARRPDRGHRQSEAHRRVRPWARGPADARLRHAPLSHGPRRRGLGRHDRACRRPGRPLHRLRGAGRSRRPRRRWSISRAKLAPARRSSPPSRAGGLAKLVDVVTVIPAQTMANDRGGKLSVLPMGSLFETAADDRLRDSRS